MFWSKVKLCLFFPSLFSLFPTADTLSYGLQDFISFSFGRLFTLLSLFFPLQVWRPSRFLQGHHTKPFEKCPCFFDNVYCVWECPKFSKEGPKDQLTFCFVTIFHLPIYGSYLCFLLCFLYILRCSYRQQWFYYFVDSKNVLKPLEYLFNSR